MKDLVGTCPDGTVLALDVPVAGTRSRESVTARQVMADRVTRSWTSTLHSYLLRTANAARLVACRELMPESIAPQPIFSDVLVELAAALNGHKRVNAP